jgi:hypothetical protein
MKRKIIIGTIITLLIISVFVIIYREIITRKQKTETTEFVYTSPRVLIITTGKDGVGNLPEGAILLIESFVQGGAYARIHNRDILTNPTLLSQYNILVLLSAINYHDADRDHSLTYMEDHELNIIKQWVANGGVLISGDNIGRNLRNGADRISIYGRLEPENWPLSECYGVCMSERNMEGFFLQGNLHDPLHGELIPIWETETWILTPDSIHSSNAEVLGQWQNDSLSFPSFIMNTYMKGMAFLLPSSYLLHPSNNGGFMNSSQIDTFCKFVLFQYYNRFPHRIELHPWPHAHSAAFAVTINSDGDIEQYKKLFNTLDSLSIKATLFVNSLLDDEISNYILANKINIQSNSWKKENMRNFSFSESVYHIEMNENHYNTHFSGFRFPFTMNSFWGMTYLNRKGYLYDSSIGIDHLNSFYGCMFPYHLPIFQDGYYQTLDMLELGTHSMDDYYFYKTLLQHELIDSLLIEHKSKIFDDYLQFFWKNNTLPHKGMMIYLGHPFFSAHSTTTLQPLINLIDTVTKDNAWLTTIEDIATRWNQIDKLQLKYSGSNKHIHITPHLEELDTIKGLTVKLYEKPKKITCKLGNSYTKSDKNCWYVVFDAYNNQGVDIWF